MRLEVKVNIPLFNLNSDHFQNYSQHRGKNSEGFFSVHYVTTNIPEIKAE